MTSYTYGAVLSWTIITDKSLLDHCSKTKCSGMVRWDSHLKTIKLRRIELYVWVWDGWEMQGPTQTNQDSPKTKQKLKHGLYNKKQEGVVRCTQHNMWSDKNILYLNFNKPYLLSCVRTIRRASFFLLRFLLLAAPLLLPFASIATDEPLAATIIVSGSHHWFDFIGVDGWVVWIVRSHMD